MKRTLSILLLMACLLVFCSCGGPESTYKSAQNLLTQGKYSEAAEKFESISTYEDSASSAQYCKAVILAEAGDYQKTIPTFENLGNFKDCAMRAAYYKGRYYESLVEQGDLDQFPMAAECYQTFPLFQDSAQRLENLSASLYQQAAEMDWDDAIHVYSLLGDYRDSQALMQECQRQKQAAFEAWFALPHDWN